MKLAILIFLFSVGIGFWLGLVYVYGWLVMLVMAGMLILCAISIYGSFLFFRKL